MRQRLSLRNTTASSTWWKQEISDSQPSFCAWCGEHLLWLFSVILRLFVHKDSPSAMVQTFSQDNILCCPIKVIVTCSEWGIRITIISNKVKTKRTKILSLNRHIDCHVARRQFVLDKSEHSPSGVRVQSPAQEPVTAWSRNLYGRICLKMCYFCLTGTHRIIKSIQHAVSLLNSWCQHFVTDIYKCHKTLNGKS